VTLERDDVLARAAEWVWVPSFATELRTAEYRVVAFPEHFAEPTEAMPVAFGSTRHRAQVLDDVLDAAAALGRNGVTIMGLNERTRPEGLEAHLVERGASLRETLAVLAAELSEGVVDLAAPDDVEVREVDGLQPLRDYDRIGVEVFGGTLRTEDELTTAVGQVDGRDPMLVAYRDGTAVGTGGYTVAGDVLRLWGGAVLPEARGTGVYRAVLDHRLRAGRALGCRVALVKGRVETSAPVLRRAGFATYGEERAYHATAR
jgi:GNAT superfamily N-acetyltransferase